MSLAVRGAILVAALTAVAGCGPTEPVRHAPVAMAITSGNEQPGVVNTLLPNPLAVRVMDEAFNPLPGLTVNFAVTSGAATVSPTSAVTNDDGRTQTEVTLGATPGTVIVTATVAGTTLDVVFTLSATAATTTCPDTADVALGAVIPMTSSSVCLRGGPNGSEYALVAFNGTLDTDPTAGVAAAFSATGVDTPGVLATRIPASAPAFSLEPANGPVPSETFEDALRQREVRELEPRFRAGGRFRQDFITSAGPSTTTIPAVGSYMTFNVQTSSGCTNARYRTARVVAVTNRAVVLADTSNPAGGFTDAEYAQFGADFDTVVTVVDEANFGLPTDVDANGGRSLILFTKAVNELTPKGSGSYVGGFFYARDLFPKSDPDTSFACPASNYAEMFYMLVPDPNGTVNENVRPKDFVASTTLGTIAHEYQHLINAGRRLYVNHAPAFEVVWLNEGLSHIAEELMFYHASGYTPGENLGGDSLDNTPEHVSAFNRYMANNAARYALGPVQGGDGGYIRLTSLYGPFRFDDALADRGAVWSALRYLSDRKGIAQQATWYALVNSTTTGMTNMAGVFGADVVRQIRDWAVGVLTDDLPTAPVAPPYQHPSWNFRTIMPLFGGNYGASLETWTLTSRPLTLGLAVSGTAHVRFRVAANANGMVRWIGVGGNVTPVTLVRTK